MKHISAFVVQPSRILQQAVDVTEIGFANPLDLDASSHYVLQNGLNTMLSASASTVPEKTFEAIAPDTSILVGLSIVVLVSIAAGFVWNNSVVPISRTKLALSKRDGEVRTTLCDIT